MKGTKAHSSRSRSRKTTRRDALKNLHEIKEGLAEFGEKVRHSFVEGKATAAQYLNKEALQEGQKKAKDQLNHLSEKLNNEVKEKPKQTLFFSFIIGLIVGRWILK